MYYADLSPVIGSELAGIRPIVIVSNDISNKYSPTIIAVAITSQINKAKLPTHVEISANEYGLNRDSVVLTEQVRMLDKKRLKEKIGAISIEDMLRVDRAVSIALNTLNQSEVNDEVREINVAINILKGIAKKYNVKEYSDADKQNEYEEMYKKNQEELKEIVIDGISKFDGKISPLLEKQKIAKGMLSEYAVIEYFKSQEYSAEKGDSKLDALKIDVVAKSDEYKIFTQVKNGSIGASDIVKLVENVVALPNEYDEENLLRLACVSAGEYPANSEILRMRLEKQFSIPIMFIHKYQVLSVCPSFKRTIK